ncbi:uncharacterized protein [Apostichopus japonicus]|uniref:uncharacterized protein isoform X2 n=1 Tax=Stichopus japonicus TaxID=307972 RepID=UPI003AB7F881
MDVCNEAGSGLEQVVERSLTPPNTKRSFKPVLYREIWKCYLERSVAYVAQQAWIQNDTVKGNVLFGKDLNSTKYEKILQACPLQRDLELLSLEGSEDYVGQQLAFDIVPPHHPSLYYLPAFYKTYASLDTNTTLPSTLSIHNVSLQKEFLFFPSAVLGWRLILSGGGRGIGHSCTRYQRLEVLCSDGLHSRFQ